MCKANCDGANNLSFLPSRMFTWSYKQQKKPLHMKKKKKRRTRTRSRSNGRRRFLQISESQLHTCGPRREGGGGPSRWRGREGIVTAGTDTSRDFTWRPSCKVHPSAFGGPGNTAFLVSMTENRRLLCGPDAGTSRLFREE